MISYRTQVVVACSQTEFAGNWKGANSVCEQAKVVEAKLLSTIFKTCELRSKRQVVSRTFAAF